ncbi:MAG: hypothetical protein H6619_03570 [Deltaproteobacteria bacterium]|nr:hypothetical protein [Deltaproteobacteria bacterium]
MNRILPILFSLLISSSAYAQHNISGHLKTQITFTDFRAQDLQNVLGSKNSLSNQLDFRLNYEYMHDRFKFDAQTEALSLYSNALDTQRSILNQNPFALSQSLLINDRRRLFDLTNEFQDDTEVTSVVRLDRLSASYLGDQTVLKVGRQALSWGNSLIFQAIDPFNPFSPTEIDKDYKTGDDMVYSQYLFESGADIQAIVIPRRDPLTGNLNGDQSTFASKFKGTLSDFEIEYDLVAGRHYDENILGIGISKPIGEALWRFDASYTEINSGNNIWNIVTNIDQSWVIRDTNVYGYLELYHSGLGTSENNYQTIKPALLDRINRGELFTIGKNYLASGLRIELTPLVNFYPVNILNLADRSGFAQFKIQYDFLQNTSLLIGLNLPYGDRGTEFGGIPTGTGSYLTAGTSGYLRLSFFF